MADKPSRALVIYGDGLASAVLPSHNNLHSFASRAACGFLSVRASPPSETEDERICRDLAQLLDAYDFYLSDKRGEAEAAVFQTLSERFMGLRAAMITSCPSVQSLGRKLGFHILHDSELVIDDGFNYKMLEQVPDSLDIASKFLHLLGFSGNDVLEKYDFDLVFLHIKTCEKFREKKEMLVSNMDVNMLNGFVGKILEKSHSGSAIGSRLHFSIILSYGYVSEDDKLCSLLSRPSTETNSDLCLLCPCQSYTMKGGHKLDNIRHHHPMLIGQLQEGLTRRDTATTFFFEDFKKNGASHAILSDRFLHEVAFRLWKAPKYGA
ncbi:uncharacterized protein LOC110025534 [Phalaenopsis equestris]|uniref:uncharacterized protein LOC110025534 n=1 Tax=Phalaenopsis equestris TaxID=78828 RepID=UPI0009E4B098|nr:uncharacterized protein LOC110025534 [Phalaenopsis equestris]XP_020581737.1 uncharacterized protein LOC110025534 [Phalaenopsis equestris]